MIASNVVRHRLAVAATAALAVGVALPGIAAAQGVAAERVPAGALLVVDGNGQPVGLLVPSTATPAAEPDPLVEMMALQSVLMRQMQAQMADVVGIADRPQTGSAASGLVIRSITMGPDGCSRTVIWRQGPSDPAPKMVLDRVADRCADAVAGTASGPQTIVDVHARSAPAAKHPF